MNCNYLLEDKKCSLVSHMKIKEGFAISEKKVCLYNKGKRDCKYYQNESTEDYVNKDYKEDEFSFEKLKKKRYFEEEGE